MPQPSSIVESPALPYYEIRIAGREPVRCDEPESLRGMCVSLASSARVMAAVLVGEGWEMMVRGFDVANMPVM